MAEISFGPYVPLLLGFYLLEVGLLYISSSDDIDASEPMMKSETERVRSLRSRALTLGGLIVAIISFLIQAEIEVALNETLTTFAFSLSFLAVSYQLGDYAPHHPLWEELQDHSLTYGFFLAIAGLFSIYEAFAPGAGSVLLVSLGVIALIRIYTVRVLLVERDFEKRLHMSDEDFTREELRADALRLYIHPKVVLPSLFAGGLMLGSYNFLRNSLRDVPELLVLVISIILATLIMRFVRVVVLNLPFVDSD